MVNPNHVSVTVISARNLKIKGKNGKNDAYVVIQLGDKKFQTSIQKKSVEPFWEEECDFFYDNKYAELVLTVYHRNLLGFDEFLGQLRLPLDEVAEPPKTLNPNHQPASRWFPLRGKISKSDKQQKYRGELEVRLSFSRKQAPADEQQNLSRSKSPSISSFTLGRQNSTESQQSKQKTSTLPLPGRLKKKAFMGSMPALFGGSDKKMSGPHSPTGSTMSLAVTKKKKKGLFSKLKPSSSLNLHKDKGEKGASNEAIPDSNAQSRSRTLGTPLGSPRKPRLEPLSEKVAQDPDDDQANEDHQPVIKAQKRGGGLFTLGKGDKQRPASADAANNQSDDAQNKRHTVWFDYPTGANGAVGSPVNGEIGARRSSISESIKDFPVNAGSSREDLLAVINEQRLIISRQKVRMRELEDYIDNLLVRVMTNQPELLSADNGTLKRSGSAPHRTKGSSFSFGLGK